jgi:hypothetical protein
VAVKEVHALVEEGLQEEEEEGVWEWPLQGVPGVVCLGHLAVEVAAYPSPAAWTYPEVAAYQEKATKAAAAAAAAVVRVLAWVHTWVA